MAYYETLLDEAMEAAAAGYIQCPACAGAGWHPGPAEHHPNCDGSCRDGRCPIQRQAECGYCAGTKYIPEQAARDYELVEEK